MNSRAVVVTGGAGFIGSHLAEELARRCYRVIILDDLSTGKLENISHILRPANQQTEFIHGSITELPLLTKLFRGVDYVFHLAAIPSVPRSIENPRASHDANITGTLNVLLAARDAGVKKVVYASSSSVYGDTPTLPKREDMPPNPQSPYAVTKLAGEYYCQVFRQVYGLPTVCLRYFNVYGPRQDPNSQYAAVIPRFVHRAVNSKPPVIFGDGEQTRDFTFVKDTVEATILAAETDATGVCNIGRGERISINRLAELVIKLVGNSVEPAHEEPRPGDIKHSLADISRARQFGYNPRYDLEEGLRQTILDFT
jgi:UDP-glucose 4-epimerase